MRPLLTAWEKVAPRLASAPFLLALFDFDGTLAPIVERPEEAFLPTPVRRLLAELVRCPLLQIGVISGRSLRDVKSRVGLEGISYTGNHGLEIEGPGFHFVHPLAGASRPLLEEAKRRLTEIATAFPGAIVEDKGLTLAFHVRPLPEELRAQAKVKAEEALAPFFASGRLWKVEGKLVLEARPPVAWDKGCAVRFLTERIRARGIEPLVLYAGDDETDEAAFAAVGDEGVGIYVGGPREGGKASFFLKRSEEMVHFLKRLLTLRRRRGDAHPTW